MFYKFNIYSVQLAVKTQLIYCTVCKCIKTTCFGLFWPSSGFSCSLESEVSYRQIYHIDDEIYEMYKTTCFGLFWPSSGFSYSLESEVSYRQIYNIHDEISKLLLWREY